MTTIVVLNISGNMIRVECDGLARDAVLTKNIVLTGCKELDTEARDGTALETKLWSVPETVVLSYAVGKVAATPAPVAEAPAVEAPVAPAAPQHVWTEEEKAARRARYAARDEATRTRRASRKAKPVAEATPAVEAASEPAPKKKGGRRKKATDPAP